MPTPGEAPVYTSQELEQLWLTIAHLRSRSEAEEQAAAAAVASGRCPAPLAPFWPLAAANDGLFAKLGRDRRLERYSFYGLFPGVYELVYESDQPPEVAFEGRARGRVAIFRSDRDSLVVKPAQSQREGEIAAIAGELSVGPRQRPSLPGFLSEDLVPGRFFTELPPDAATPDAMHRIGHTLGGMLARLHARGIFYNDVTLADPNGRSHLLVTGEGDCRLIDFGVSLLLDQHPRLSLEEVYNFARTLPAFRILTGMGISHEEMGRFLEEYRARLARTSREEIMGRDLRFLEEGLSMAAGRLGRHIVEPLRRGFFEAYG